MSPLLTIAALSILVPALFYSVQIRYSFNLSDEGFFWYGVRQIGFGDVPLRDFMAYDPGRYYASAAIAPLFGGNGLIAVRWTTVFYEGWTVFTVLSLLYSSARRISWLFSLIVTIALVFWLTPYFKIHDFLACALLLFGLARLIQLGRVSDFAVAGVCVGVAAVLGRNHGVYGVIGSSGVFAWLAMRRETWGRLPLGVAGWSAGVVVGYAPILLMMALVPGFGAAMVESVRLMFAYGSTNIALPVPWPWRISLAALSPMTIRRLIVGTLFLLLAAFSLLAPIWTFIQRFRGRPIAPATVAGSVLALPYAQYAFSRADVVHLALGILPLLTGLFVFAARQRAPVCNAMAIVICGVSAWTLAPEHIGYFCNNSACVATQVGTDSMIVEPHVARELRLLNDLTLRYAANNRPVLVVPFWPGAYPVLGRASPIWEIYPILPRDPAFERNEIERLAAAKPVVVLMDSAGLDGREDMRFSSTHPLTYQWILDHLHPGADPPIGPYQLFTERPTQ